jgi:LPS-assembly protein
MPAAEVSSSSGAAAQGRQEVDSYNSHALLRRMVRRRLLADDAFGRCCARHPHPARERCTARSPLTDRSLPSLTLLGLTFGLAALPSAVGAQGSAPALKLERLLGSGRAEAELEGVSFARAQRITGEGEERIVLDGDAEVRRGGAVLRGDRIVYETVRDEVNISGNARVFRDGVVFAGPSLKLRIDAQTGNMPDASFTYAPQRGRGTSRVIDFIEGNRVRFNDAQYTTCAPGDEAWWVRANRLTLDRDEELAIANGAAVYFFGVPIFASPYFQFPLGDRRRSGLLTPSFGINSRLGPEVTVPIYWDIAPNRDATFTPRFMARRGVLLSTELRYLEPTHRGTLEFDVIGKDRVFGGSREFISARQEYANPRGVVGGLNFNRVTDDRFFSDFSRNIVGASQRVLPQEAYVGFNQPLWNTALRVTKNQTIQDPADPISEPYERVPQLTLNAGRPNWGGFELRLAAEATGFEHPTLATGSRVVMNPSVAYPLQSAGWFVVPKLQWHSSWYRIDATSGGAARQNRHLPIGSIDSGLVFERESRWFGAESLQTLEPRLFYAWIPFRDQSSLPNFDSAVADFNFSQLFNENFFSGSDRIGETNQVTAALLGRVIDPASGGERLYAALGQRFYFSSQRVTLPGGSPRAGRESDLLFSLRGTLARHWITDLSLQHSRSENRLIRAAAALRWQPRPAQVLSLAYRYKLDDIEQVDMSGQWPISERWYGVGRANYSLRDGRWIEALAGFEYKADCWVLRVAAQRFATIAQTKNTSLIFQLQLNGLTSIGTGAVEQLRRNIPGYQVINAPPVVPGRFDEYE